MCSYKLRANQTKRTTEKNQREQLLSLSPRVQFNEEQHEREARAPADKDNRVGLLRIRKRFGKVGPRFVKRLILFLN